LVSVVQSHHGRGGKPVEQVSEVSELVGKRQVSLVRGQDRGEPSGQVERGGEVGSHVPMLAGKPRLSLGVWPS
jgi:hypothetical protein